MSKIPEFFILISYKYVMVNNMFQVISPEALLFRNRHLHPTTRTMNDILYFLNLNEFRVELEDIAENDKKNNGK